MLTNQYHFGVLYSKKTARSSKWRMHRLEPANMTNAMFTWR